MRKSLRLSSVLMFLSVALQQNARADAFVSVALDGFSPSSVTIAVHQYVWFTVADDNGPYTVSSTRGDWVPWYLFDLGDGFGMQINEMGTYNYYDAFNWNYGVIHVVPTPDLIIVSPAEGSTYHAPASFAFGVEAADNTSGVSSVQLYLGADLLAELYSRPFSTLVTDLPAGSYTLTAIARNTVGGATTNTVHISVESAAPPSMTLSAPRIMGNQFRFDAGGFTVGKSVVLQYATALSGAAWTSLETNLTSSSQVTFAQPVLSGNRFFRVVQLP